MKLVIYKSDGVYCVTPKTNYDSYIWDTRKIQRLDGFETADEVIDYYCKYSRSKLEDFIII